MSMKEFLFLGIVIFGFAFVNRLSADHPNVILVMADDLGWRDVGFNGGDTIKTPQLDAMARNGIVFERFYASSPVCSPTRGSMLTGRHPYRLGIPFANKGYLKPREMTLAEMLRDKGYRTGHFGKWHLGTLTTTVKDANRGGPKNPQLFSPPQKNGFDVCFSTESKVPTWDPMWKPKNGQSKNSWNAMTDPKLEGVAYGTRYWDQTGRHVTENLRGCDSRAIVDRVEPFIRESVSQGKPFFAVVWFHAPHYPVVAGPKYYAMYPDAKSEHHRNYYGCITALDQQVGRIRNVLGELSASENTLIAFCSDNGPEGNANAAGRAEPFSGRKRSLLEGGVRVPGVIEWPAKIKPGTRSNVAAVTSDLLPTIAEIVNATMTVQPVDGVSLISVFEGSKDERSKPLGFVSGRQSAWHEGRFKIYRSKQEAWKLYDLDADPSESTDLASSKPAMVTAMSRRYEVWRKSLEEQTAKN